jgi:hypothetical protein
VHYPEAETIRLVMDNLNTHLPSSLYAIPQKSLFSCVVRKSARLNLRHFAARYSASGLHTFIVIAQALGAYTLIARG